MKDNLKISLKGQIKITSNKQGVLYNSRNTIGEDALEIITRCLTQLDFIKSVNIVKASGDFGDFDASTTDVFYNASPNSIMFRAIFYENDFAGTIEDLKLMSTALPGKVMAFKTGLSIEKDNSERVQVDWRIYIQTS